MTLIRLLIPWSLAVYLSFLLVYGETIFDTSFADDENDSQGFLDAILDFFSSAFDIVGDIVQFITLGGFDSPLPGLLQTILLLTIGLGWFLVALGLARGSSVG